MTVVLAKLIDTPARPRRSVVAVWGSDFRDCKQKEGSSVLEHRSVSTSSPIFTPSLIDCAGLMHRIASNREINKEEAQKEGPFIFVYYQLVGLISFGVYDLECNEALYNVRF